MTLNIGLKVDYREYFSKKKKKKKNHNILIKKLIILFKKKNIILIWKNYFSQRVYYNNYANYLKSYLYDHKTLIY